MIHNKRLDTEKRPGPQVIFLGLISNRKNRGKVVKKKDSTPWRSCVHIRARPDSLPRTRCSRTTGSDPVSSFWFILFIWLFVWGWKSEERLTVIGLVPLLSHFVDDNLGSKVNHLQEPVYHDEISSFSLWAGQASYKINRDVGPGTLWDRQGAQQKGRRATGLIWLSADRAGSHKLMYIFGHSNGWPDRQMVLACWPVH